MKDCFKNNFDLNIEEDKVLTPVRSEKGDDARSISPDSN